MVGCILEGGPKESGMTEQLSTHMHPTPWFLYFLHNWFSLLLPGLHAVTQATCNLTLYEQSQDSSAPGPVLSQWHCSSLYDGNSASFLSVFAPEGWTGCHWVSSVSLGVLCTNVGFSLKEGANCLISE